MKAMTLKARAKINLSLDVLGKRPNGYHDVEMIMQQIELYDDVTVTLTSNETIELTTTESFLPTNEDNIAYRAAALMKNHFHLKRGFKIHIEKRIPIAAGLAGGSTDAAAVMIAINALCELGQTTDTLMKLGSQLGADVPFCMLKGCAFASGIGDELKPIKALSHTCLLLVKPSFGVSTKEIYQSLDVSQIKEHPRTQTMLEALENENKFEVIKGLHNVLEEVTLTRYPEVLSIKQQLTAFGAENTLMSGSGPTVFAIFKDYCKAKLALKKIKKSYPQSFVVMTYSGEDNKESSDEV